MSHPPTEPDGATRPPDSPYAPGSAPVHPGVPMSGPPLGQPVSASPAFDVPYPGVPTGPGAGGAGRGRTMLVLAAVAGLLFVLGGLMTGLFVAKSGELTRTERTLTAQIADRDSRLEANSKELERLRRELQAANDRIEAVEQDLTGTKNDRDEQQRQKEIIVRCLNLTGEALATGNARIAREAGKVCAEAQKYL